MTEWTVRPPVWISANPTLENYLAIFGERIGATGTGVEGQVQLTLTVVGGVITPAMPAILNSVLAAGSTTLAAVFIGYLAAYAISRFRTGGAFLYIFVLATRMLPPVGIVIPLLVFFTFFALVDTLGGLFIIYLGIHVAFVIWIVRGFIDDVPIEIEESAKLDGMGKWSILFKVTFPLVKGGLAAAALFVFILTWTEFGVALIMTRADATTIPIQLLKYSFGGGPALGPISALSVIVIIPVIILGYVIQKQMVRGLSMGAIKGAR